MRSSFLNNYTVDAPVSQPVVSVRVMSYSSALICSTNLFQIAGEMREIICEEEKVRLQCSCVFGHILVHLRAAYKGDPEDTGFRNW